MTNEDKFGWFIALILIVIFSIAVSYLNKRDNPK